MSLFIIIENVQTLKHKQVVQLWDVRRDIKICFYPKLTVLEKHLLTWEGIKIYFIYYVAITTQTGAVEVFKHSF